MAKKILETSKPRKAGQPTKYDPDFHPQELMKKGKEGNSIAMVACDWDIHKDTIWEWNKVHPEFSVAFKKYKMNLEAFYTKLGLKMATGGFTKSNPAIFIWLTKNIIGWSDKIEIQDASDVDFELDE